MLQGKGGTGFGRKLLKVDGLQMHTSSRRSGPSGMQPQPGATKRCSILSLQSSCAMSSMDGHFSTDSPMALYTRHKSLVCKCGNSAHRNTKHFLESKINREPKRLPMNTVQIHHRLCEKDCSENRRCLRSVLLGL